MQKLFDSSAKQPSHHNSSSQTTRVNRHGPCFKVGQVVESRERYAICLGRKARQNIVNISSSGLVFRAQDNAQDLKLQVLGNAQDLRPRLFVLGRGTLSIKNIVGIS